MSAELSLEGLDQLLRRTDSLGKQGSKMEDKALKAGASVILEEVKNTTAFKDQSGKLRDGLKASAIKRKGGRKHILIGIEKCDTSPIYYGKFIEWGTSKMKAKPFLEPALENKRSEAVDKMAAIIRSELGL